jgi:hypothetical protein
MPDSTLRMSSSEIRRCGQQKLDAMLGYLALLRRPDVFVCLTLREKAKEAVRGYYEAMDKGMLLDNLASDYPEGEGPLVDMDEVVVAEMRRVDPGLYFLLCMQRQQYTDARMCLPKILDRLERDCNVQRDYVRTLVTGKG